MTKSRLFSIAAMGIEASGRGHWGAAERKNFLLVGEEVCAAAKRERRCETKVGM
jgi:hypothetical protein